MLTNFERGWRKLGVLLLTLALVPAMTLAQGEKDRDKGSKGGSVQGEHNKNNNNKNENNKNANNKSTNSHNTNSSHGNSNGSNNNKNQGNVNQGRGSSNQGNSGHSVNSNTTTNNNVHNTTINNNINVRNGGHFTPPAGSKTTSGPNGGFTHTASDGRTWNTDHEGHVTSFSRTGMQANFNARGNVTYVHDTTRNVTINRTTTNVRVVSVVRPGGVHVVSYGGRVGFVEHPWVGHPGFVARTYIYGGRPFVAVYRPWAYGGWRFNVWVPGVYYAPRFYAWGLAPWGVGVHFGWGWGGAAWFGFYGGYFNPYPVYAAPNYWLTDYIISQDLQAAYAAQAAANAAQASANAAQAAADSANASANAQVEGQVQGSVQGGGQVTLSPEVKQAIADEVQRQLQEQQAQAANPQAMQGATSDQAQTGVPPALDPKTRMFIVSSPLSVTTSDGTACALSGGDVITRIDDTPDQNGTVRVSVVSSKQSSCSAGSQPRVQVADLQEMNNDFQAQIEKGMGQLSQGGNGLPTAPAADPQQTAAGQAQVDPNAVQMLQQSQQTANQSEADAKAAANGGGNGNGSGNGSQPNDLE